MKQRIVITRPAHQAAALAEGIHAAGGDVLLFPTLEIAVNPLTQKNKDIIEKINDIDIIIFISQNAVEHGLNQIQAITSLPESVQLATIGQGSARSIHAKLGKQPDIVPKENFNSEGLLATPAMENVANKRILIIKGNGGREYLQNTLRQRGAIVETLNAYQRVKPTTSSTELEQHLQNNQIAAIVITSAESLKNLLELTPKKVISQLLQVPLLLMNKRLIDIARGMGFNNNLFIATEASDSAIIETLQKNQLLP